MTNNLASKINTQINLQKAFDTINHNILLNKLDYYGVRGISNVWFETFLKERYQYTTNKEHSSEKLMSMHGVPQGSVLGPALYITLQMTPTFY